MKTIRSSTVSLVALLLWLGSGPVCLRAQNRTSFAGVRNAVDYAYGVVPNVSPLIIDIGSNTTGSASTVTVRFGSVTAGDGKTFSPLNVNAPILVGGPTNQETVTPSAVSCSTPAIYDTCQVTATFTKTHGQGESISSGSVGLQEAINIQSAAIPVGGGLVAIESGWVTYGGTTSIITSAAALSDVAIVDNRGGATQQYWTMQPTTLTTLAVPTTLTSSTVTFQTSPAGTFASSAYYLCLTYIDALGGEGPCSATYNATPGAGSSSMTVTSPAASTGAVGWRMYAGASYNAAYLLPITSSICTLTTLESVLPACAIGAGATFLTAPTTTTTLRPNAQTSPTVNVNLPYAQGHTTFGYEPTGTLPLPFQTDYGPFTAFGSTTSGQVDVIGGLNLPAGYLNQIGRAVRISGKIAATVNTAAVPTVTISLGWVAGTTAGAPVAVCTNTGAAYGSSAAFNLTFDCTLTTNALGASAATIMTKGLMQYNVAAGGAAGVTTIDTGTAAIASLGLSEQNTVYVSYTSGSGTSSAVQLLDLHFETLQ